MSKDKVSLPEGYKVYYEYYRVPSDLVDKRAKKEGKPHNLRPYIRRPRLNMGDDSYSPYSNGGEVVCFVYAPDGETIVGLGTSVCSMSETFNYKKGRNIALGRAIKYVQARHALDPMNIN